MRIFQLPIFIEKFLPQLLVELEIVSHRVEGKKLVTFTMIDVGKPASGSQSSHYNTIYLFISRAFLFVLDKPMLILLCDVEIHITVQRLVPKPNQIVFEIGENLLVCYRIHTP